MADAQPDAAAAATEPRDDEEALLARAQAVIARVLERETDANLDPNPRLLHTLATLCEFHEQRYDQLYTSNPPLNNIHTRGSYTIGKLANLLRDNDDFYDLVFCKFLSDTSYSIAVHAAAARLLLSCQSAWTPEYPHVFEDPIIENIKNWVTQDAQASDESEWRCLGGDSKPTDAQMLRTYSIGLLAIALCSGGPLVEGVLDMGVSAKLMHFLRLRVLGDASCSQKDANHPTNTKHSRARDDNRGKSRQAQESSRLDRISTGLGDHAVEMDNDTPLGVRQPHGQKCTDDPNPTCPEHADASFDEIDTCDRKSKHQVVRLGRDEDIVENCEPLKRKLSRAGPQVKVKGKAGQNLPGYDTTPVSPPSGLRMGGRANRDRNASRIEEPKKATDPSNSSGTISREEYQDHFRDCIIGLKDISSIVLKAVRAAEAEARSANAPDEAVKAAGDAAAVLVKSSALEVWKSENNGDAVVLAAVKAASTVVEAAMPVNVLRSSNQVTEEPAPPEAVQTNEDQALEDFVISDHGQLLRLREKYSIQCLHVLGEYVEVLGPVLHEKGVEVSLALLQRSINDKEGCGHFLLLPDVLKLICALAAHRKFAALFVDCGGMQKILAVPRVTQTYTALSASLFTFGSLQSIMERVCALSSSTLDNMVELALQLLECPQDLARKSAAMFFAAAFVFKAVLDLFDARNGMQKILDILKGCASGSGGNSGVGSSNANQGNDRLPAEVSSEKQVAYHTGVALRQYFRAHLLQLVDSIRPSRSVCSIARNTSSARAGYKPFDISNEAMEAVFRQIQQDRKLAPALVRARWPVLERFIASNGHVLMLELCKFQAHGDRYLRDLTQYAIGVLHIMTLMPFSRKYIVTNNIAVLLGAVESFDYEVICPALNVLVNLVCPPPSMSNKPSSAATQQPSQASIGTSSEIRDRNLEKSVSDKSLTMNPGESQGSGDGNTSHQGNTIPVVPSGIIGDRRISLGVGAGGPGLAAQLEQWYHQAREVVRANNGIKILLQLLSSRMVTHPAAIGSIRALACRVLLGLARDDTIAHALIKLQVGKNISELIRETSAQTSGGDSGRWQTELTQVATELIEVLTEVPRALTPSATSMAGKRKKLSVEMPAVGNSGRSTAQKKDKWVPLWDDVAEQLFCRTYIEFLSTCQDSKNLTVEEKFTKIAELMSKSQMKFAPSQLASKFNKLKRLYREYTFPQRRTAAQWRKLERTDAVFRRIKNGEPPPNFDLLTVIFKDETDSNISITNNSAQIKAKDLKRPSHRPTCDHTPVKLAMAGTGCCDVAATEHVLADMIAERINVCTDDTDGSPYVNNAYNGADPTQDENVVVERKDEINCSKDNTVEGSKNSHSKKEFDREEYKKEVTKYNQLKKCYIHECNERRRLNNELIELKGNIRVFCRCRPRNGDEVSRGCPKVVTVDPECDQVHITLSEKETRTFRLDHVFGPESTQVDVFDETVPMIRSVMDGFDVCIFAYGQTGTGKTFTMEGTPENRGVNYRALEELFKLSKERRSSVTSTFSVSMLEVYNDVIYDLLGDRSNRLEIKQSSDGTQDVPGLVDSPVCTIDEVWQKLKTGARNRSVGSTNANKFSSRSHSFVRVRVCSQHIFTGQESESYLWLVDLAGSERLDKTGAVGDRLKESQFINKSLSALGDVISALASKSGHIPYRNSKLTHLLQSSLGGDGKSLMFVQISPCSSDSSETLSSLKYATRVRSVEQGHSKLEQMSKKLKQAEKENEELKRTLQLRDNTIRLLNDKVKELGNEVTKGKRTGRDDYARSPTSRPSALVPVQQRKAPQGRHNNYFSPDPSRSRFSKAPTIHNKENLYVMAR